MLFSWITDLSDSLVMAGDIVSLTSARLGGGAPGRFSVVLMGVLNQTNAPQETRSSSGAKQVAVKVCRPLSVAISGAANADGSPLAFTDRAATQAEHEFVTEWLVLERLRSSSALQNQSRTTGVLEFLLATPVDGLVGGGSSSEAGGWNGGVGLVCELCQPGSLRKLLRTYSAAQWRQLEASVLGDRLNLSQRNGIGSDGCVEDNERGGSAGAALVRLAFAADVTAGLQHLHSLGFLHRDLALRNVLLRTRGDGSVSAVLADYGESAPLDLAPFVRASDSLVAYWSARQPTRWQATEVWESGTYGVASEVHSCAILVWEMFSASAPFAREPSSSVRRKLCHNAVGGPRELLPQYPEPKKQTQGDDGPQPGIPDDLYALLCRCWDRSAPDRPSVREVQAFCEHASGERTLES
jgi:serine/threonine protein kinase